MAARLKLPPQPLILPTAVATTTTTTTTTTTSCVVGLGIGRASSNPTAAAAALHVSELIAPPAPQSLRRHPSSHGSSHASDSKFCAFGWLRRESLFASLGLLSGALWIASTDNTILAMASEFADMPALRGKDYGKTKMRYPDYTETESGLQYKDLRVGNGSTPKMDDTVVVDWDGYTIGYYGRIFEARNKTKGGSFVGDDKDFLKFKLGSGEVIPAFEEAVSGMAPGGIRRIIVPPELGYPENNFNKSGPRPTTFSGQRALDFVLRNRGLIDKTLLFDIELLKIIPS